MNFVELLHKDDITIEEIKTLFDFVCKLSDGINVPQLREEFGLTSSDEDLWKWYKSLVWETKSKLTSSFNFCHKAYQLVTIFGLRGEGNVILRQGTNEHMLMEYIYTELEPEMLISEYKEHKSIIDYLTIKLKDTAVKLIGTADYESAMNSIDNTEGERDHYIMSIAAIAKWLNKYYKWIIKIIGLPNANEYFFPIGLEVELYDTEHFRHGLIDAVYKNPNGGYMPVDFKFGKPKRKKDVNGNPTNEPYYYMKSVRKEITFYKWLAESPTCFEPDELTGEMKEWKPINCPTGEMWYILDYEHGRLEVSFTTKDNIELLTLEAEYWKRMNTMDYPYDDKLGWRSSRFKKLCNARKVDGTYKCDKRPLCNHFDSFKALLDETTKLKEILEIMNDV